MYPKFVLDEFGSGADYFFALPAANELDDSGVLRKDVLDTMDVMLQAQMAQRLAGFEIEHNGIGTKPENRWRTVSSMQKAIRFGYAEHAEFAATAAHDMDYAYVMRRLGVTAVEDVGFGSVWGMCAPLAALGSRAWRRKVGERKLVAFLAKHLASAAKDRLLCDLVCLADFTTGVDKATWATSDDQALLDVVWNKDWTIDLRAIAAWLVAGTKRFEGETMPKDNARSMMPLLRSMHEHKLPRAMLYVAIRTASRLNEILFAMVPFMHEAMVKHMATTAPLTLVVQKLPIEPMPMVGLLLGAAYDMHTREGRIALRKFELENGEIGEFRHMLGDRTHENMLMGLGAFNGEGGLLKHRVAYGPSTEWMELSHRREMMFPGLPEEQVDPFLETFRKNLPQLNEIREKVLWATKHH